MAASWEPLYREDNGLSVALCFFVCRNDILSVQNGAYILHVEHERSSLKNLRNRIRLRNEGSLDFFPTRRLIIFHPFYWKSCN